MRKCDAFQSWAWDIRLINVIGLAGIEPAKVGLTRSCFNKNGKAILPNEIMESYHINKEKSKNKRKGSCKLPWYLITTALILF